MPHLYLTPKDLNDHKLTIQKPKSGKHEETVFITRNFAERLRTFIEEKTIEPGQKIFPITYAAARVIAKRQGNWSE